MARHSKIPTLGGNVANNVTDGLKNNVALEHPYLVGSDVASLVKFRLVG